MQIYVWTFFSFLFYSIYGIFLRKTQKDVEKSNFKKPIIEDLEKFKQIGDKLADNVTFEAKQHVKSVKDFLYMIKEQATLDLDDKFTLSCKKFIQETNKQPSWVNKERIKVAQSVYLQHTLNAGISGFGALIESYTFGDGAKILLGTGRLSSIEFSMIRKRLYETQHFVTSVMAHGDCTIIGSEGHNAALRVRLLHSNVRKYVLKGEWDSKVFGYPVNQEDMAHTVLLMGRTYLKGMELLGTVMTDYEKDCFIHLWRYIGYVMGTDERLMVDNYKDANTLWDVICEHSQKITDVGRVLTKSNLDAMHLQPVLFFTSSIYQRIVRHLLNNDKISDELGLMKSGIIFKIILNLYIKLYQIWCYAIRYIPLIGWIQRCYHIISLKFIYPRLIGGWTLYGFETGISRRTN